MKTKLPYLALIALFLISACCTKKACQGHIYKDVLIIFKGYTADDLRAVRIQVYDKNTDSLIAPSYLDYNSIVSDSSIHLGSQFMALPDSFYLDQRYLTVTSPGRLDTINNISYQYSHHMVNCNSCPGQGEPVTDVVNFTYSYNGVVHHEGDTVFVVK